MYSPSLISTNDKIDYEYEKKKNYKAYSNSINSFKAFDSVLFMSEYLGKEENHLSEKSIKEKENAFNYSSNSNKEKSLGEVLDLKVSPSLEKCLTSELLNSITNDSNKIKKCQNFNEKETINKLKITKKLFNQQNFSNEQKNNNKIDNDKKLKKSKGKRQKTLYEETINGFEYQLKFIENSVHNILPKSYKKISNKNNQKISSNNYLDKFKNNSYLFKKSENIINYNNTNFAPFDGFNSNYDNNSTLDKENICKNHNNNNIYNVNGKKNHHQIHKLKINDNYYDNWVCNYCYCFNRGYRKVCSNCSKNRN